MEYVRQEQGKVVSVLTGHGQVLARNINYTNSGLMEGLVHGNGVVTARDFDRFTQLMGIIVEDVLDLAFARDGYGNITGITDHRNPVQNQRFIYNPEKRLTRAFGPYGELIYTYDPVRNRLSWDQNGEARAYKYQRGTNRLLSVASKR